MVVCHCQAVRERDIRKAVRCGASNRSEVASACGAALQCGGCAPLVDLIIASEQECCAPAIALEPLAEAAAG